jgi:hypothetical protein
MNDRGDVVGDLTSSNFSTTPYLYVNGTVGYLNLPNGVEGPYLYGINNAGFAYGALFNSSAQIGQVFTVLNGNLTVLPLSAPGLENWDANPRMLSNGGLLGVYGWSSTGSVSRGFVYNLNTGSLTALAVPGGFATAFVQQITGSGLIYGYAQTDDGSQRRFGFWNPDGSFRGFFDAPAGSRGILFNDLGQAIGLNNGQALFYDGTTWNPLSVSGLNGYSLLRISDFNDRGQFVGLAVNPAGTWAWGFVASPVPEHSALILLACGMAGIGVYARRRRPSPAGRRDEIIP